jgi:diguanylate cyclase (GGDEF)-like protein
MAYQDPLTGLCNRRFFEESLNKAINKANTLSQKVLAVMFIDLDGFKQVNDTFGHDAGDLLLREVAERLITCVREQDTIARLAGDEFTIVLPDIYQGDVMNVAQRIIKSLQAPCMINGHEVVVTASIGISFYRNQHDNAKTLMKHADIAMYTAKQEGKNTYHIYQLEHF